MNLSSISLLIILTFGHTNQQFVHELLSASEHVTELNEDLARILDVGYERQGLCGKEVTSQCCSSCAVLGYCYNGGICCQKNEVRTKMLKSGELSCPNSWTKDCAVTKMLPIESCGLRSKKHHLSSEFDRESESSENTEDRHHLKSKFRMLCVCLQTKRCCSAPAATTPVAVSTGAVTTPAPFATGATSITGMAFSTVASTSAAHMGELNITANISQNVALF